MDRRVKPGDDTAVVARDASQPENTLALSTAAHIWSRLNTSQSPAPAGG